MHEAFRPSAWIWPENSRYKYSSRLSPISGGCHPYLRNVSAFQVNFHLNRWRYSHVTSFLTNHAAMFLGPWACGSECCSSNSNAPDTSQKGLIGIQSHHPRENMLKKAREKPAETGSASVSPYGSVLAMNWWRSQPPPHQPHLAGVPYLVYRALSYILFPVCLGVLFFAFATITREMINYNLMIVFR